MIQQAQDIERPPAPGRRAVERLNATGARLYQFIPDHVGYVPNSEYLRTDTEEELFGPDAPTISVSQWKPSLKFEEGQEDVELLQAGRKNLSKHEEALLFRRYNCARYHLANLMEKQTRRFDRRRVAEILVWYHRVIENRAALTEANMALVVAMAKRTRANSVELSELVSEGNMALLRAVDKFDFSRGFKFSTYACCAIVKALNRLVTQAGIHHQRFPTNFEPEAGQGDELERRRSNRHELAIDDLRQELVLNRAGLTNVEQTVLGARFAVAGHNHVHTLQTISGLVCLSKERIRQVQNRALTKLRRILELPFSPAMTSQGKPNGAFEYFTTRQPMNQVSYPQGCSR